MGTTMTRFIVPACTLVCRSTSERRTTTAPGGAIGITTAGMATDTGHIITGAPWRVTTVAGAMMRRVSSFHSRPTMPRAARRSVVVQAPSDEGQGVVTARFAVQAAVQAAHGHRTRVQRGPGGAGTPGVRQRQDVKPLAVAHGVATRRRRGE